LRWFFFAVQLFPRPKKFSVEIAGIGARSFPIFLTGEKYLLMGNYLDKFIVGINGFN